MERTDITKINKDEIVYIWKIINYSYYARKITSPSFSSGINNKITWYLDLYPIDASESSTKDNFISLFLYIQCNDEKSLETKFSFCILNSRKEECNIYNEIRTFKKPNDGGGTYKFISQSQLKDKNLLVDDTLTIKCKIGFGIDINHTPNSLEPLNDILNINQLTQDFQKLMESGKLSDVTLAANGKEFPAHKLILSARSPVFSAIFDHDMKERNENTVFIEDIDCEVISEMLRFIYTGKVENLEVFAQELLVASDRYGLEDLKKICEGVLSKNLSVDNVSVVLVLADLHSSDKLKESALTYIINNAKSIINTPEFESLQDTHPKLIVEILRRLVLK